jgi:hypothetical protein
MITVTKGSNYRDYNDIKDREDKIIFYPNLFSGKIFNMIIDSIKNTKNSIIPYLTVGIAEITQKIYTFIYSQKYSGPVACIFLENTKLTPTNKKNNDITLNLNCKKGSLVIFGSRFRTEWDFTIPESTITFAEENYLPDIYTTTQDRFKYYELINSTIDIEKNCFTLEEEEKINLHLIGVGSYANVFKGNKGSLQFAIKFSKLNQEAVEHPFSLNYISWREVFFLKDIFKPLILNNICPNLPLLYQSFTCKEHELKLVNNKKQKYPCVVTMVELADGNLKQYLKLPEIKDDKDMIYSAIFQIMAALSTIQKYAQINHFDIKKENVLFYKIRSGGYFKYKIQNKTFYIPNKGYLFILNDFGISRCHSPKYEMYRNDNETSFKLGHRYARIEKIEGSPTFVPIEIKEQKNDNDSIVKSNSLLWIDKNNKTITSNGAIFRMDRKTKEIFPSEFPIEWFENPETIPPFEFYNDTQDVIRTFTGGKRSTQEGYHKQVENIPKKIIRQLKMFAGPSDSVKKGKYDDSEIKPTNHIFSTKPSQVLASYFITDFFTKYTEYSKNPNSTIIASYEI